MEKYNLRHVILIAVIALVIGFAAGYSIGAAASINWCVDKGMEFLEIKGYELDVNIDLLKSVISKYTRYSGLT